jgi:hypothetical protein
VLTDVRSAFFDADDSIPVRHVVTEYLHAKACRRRTGAYDREVAARQKTDGGPD